MRLLVACPQCRRQYDATGRKPGTVFRCRCGERVRIRAGRGHDASVVRCSACGAPRSPGARFCGHCGAGFTLHEQDLDTVCPGCLARISDRASFCHHCATPIVPEAVAGDSTNFTCPACGPESALTSRRLRHGPFAALECPTCGGLWLGRETLRLFIEHQSQRGGGTGQIRPSKQDAGRTRSGRTRYRPCVVCGGLMPRCNFGNGQSGVILDFCGKHGFWFDAQELSLLLAWIRSGGLPAARAELSRLESIADGRRRAGPLGDGGESSSRRVGLSGSGPGDPPYDLESSFVDFFRWFFRLT